MDPNAETADTTAEIDSEYNETPDNSQEQREETPEWSKKFKSPDEMWDSYRSLQSEYTKLKQQKEDNSEENLDDLEGLDESLEENPDEFLTSIVDKKLKEEVGDIVEYVNQQRITETIRQVHEVFPDFDFEKEGDALAEELSHMDINYRRKNPVEATLKAVAVLRGFKANAGDNSMIDKLKNYSEGTSNRKPPQQVDEVEEIIKAGKSTLPF